MPSSRQPHRRRARLTVMLATAALLSPAATIPASAQEPPPDGSIIGVVDGFLDTEFEEVLKEEVAKAIEEADQPGRSGSQIEVNLVDAGSASIAGDGATGASCRWTVVTDLQAHYQPDTAALGEVTGTPSANVGCRGGEVRPVGQRATLKQVVDGKPRATVGTARCDNRQGCPTIRLVGPYKCAGRTCAGNHQLVLEHRLTLPAGYRWVRVPGNCDTSNRGATLACRSAGETVTLPATSSGVQVNA